MTAQSLPECKFRGEGVTDQRFSCSSPKLIVGPLGVSARECLVCPYPNVDGPRLVSMVPQPAAPQDGPGTELKRLIARLGAEPQSTCQCDGRIDQMNRWGVAGCREHRDEIVSWLKQSWSDLSLIAKIRTGIRGLFSGLLDTDPITILVDRAIDGYESRDPTASPKPPPPVIMSPSRRRHLLFHMMPVAGTPAWRVNCDHLLARIDAFTGKRVCGIVTASSKCKRPLDKPEVVREYLAGHDFDFVEVPNDYRLREVATWKPMWDKLDLNEADLVFYCHSKGVTKPWNPGVTCHTWGRVMFSWLLDYLPEIEELLTQFPVVGVLPKVGQHFANSRAQWHYSGSFYWARADEVLRRKGIDKIDRVWFGVETWPGSVFLPDEMGCPHDPKLTAEVDPYQMSTWRERLLPMFAEWIKEHPRGLVQRAVQALDSR